MCSSDHKYDMYSPETGLRGFILSWEIEDRMVAFAMESETSMICIYRKNQKGTRYIVSRILLEEYGNIVALWHLPEDFAPYKQLFIDTLEKQIHYNDGCIFTYE